MSPAPQPSLIGRILRPAPAARRIAALLGLLLLAALALVALGATIRARRIEAATRQALIDRPSPALAEAEAAIMAEAFARPRAAATLADLAIHLPSATPLAEATRARDGTLRIALDTADPDALRALLGADRWFERFHEKAQEDRGEGRIRVALVEEKP